VQQQQAARRSAARQEGVDLDERHQRAQRRQVEEGRRAHQLRERARPHHVRHHQRAVERARDRRGVAQRHDPLAEPARGLVHEESLRPRRHPLGGVGRRVWADPPTTLRLLRAHAVRRAAGGHPAPRLGQLVILRRDGGGALEPAARGKLAVAPPPAHALGECEALLGERREVTPLVVQAERGERGIRGRRVQLPRDCARL